MKITVHIFKCSSELFKMDVPYIYCKVVYIERCSAMRALVAENCNPSDSPVVRLLHC